MITAPADQRPLLMAVRVDPTSVCTCTSKSYNVRYYFIKQRCAYSTAIKAGRGGEFPGRLFIASITYSEKFTSACKCSVVKHDGMAPVRPYSNLCNIKSTLRLGPSIAHLPEVVVGSIDDSGSFALVHGANGRTVRCTTACFDLDEYQRNCVLTRLFGYDIELADRTSVVGAHDRPSKSCKMILNNLFPNSPDCFTIGFAFCQSQVLPPPFSTRVLHFQVEQRLPQVIKFAARARGNGPVAAAVLRARTKTSKGIEVE